MVAVSIGNWDVAEDLSEWIELVAVFCIAIVVVAAFVIAGREAFTGSFNEAFHVFKRVIAIGLLAGLDLLIAADIIRTVTLELSIENIAALGLLVLVRTFLSWTLLLEAEGRWPWQRQSEPSI